MANLAAAAAGRLSQAAILSAPATAPVPSRTLAEAQQRARYFYRQLCRQIPWIMKNYHLDEVTTRSALRSKLASHFRRVETDNPQVVDVLLFKGQAEAHELMAHYTQRHHLITRYVAADAAGGSTSTGAASHRSTFLDRFLKSNSTE